MGEKKKLISNLPNLQTSEYLPDNFIAARGVPVVQTTKLSGNVAGEYMPKYSEETMEALKDRVPPEDIRLQKDAPFIRLLPPAEQLYKFGNLLGSISDPNMTAAHEAAHAVWDGDLSLDAKDEWNTIHNLHVGSIVSPKQNIVKTPFFSKYYFDPAHSFADAFAYYAIQPEMLKKMAPDVYQYFIRQTRFEYSRKH